MLGRDGTSYRVLHNFVNTGGDGQFPNAGLIQCSDLSFYGVTSRGGSAGYGLVFRLLPPETPFLGTGVFSNGIASIAVFGLGGFSYQVKRSTDLSNWVIISTNMMPANGSFTNVDLVAPFPKAFYRAVWMP